MKSNSHLDPGLLRRRALSFVSACVLASPAALLAQQYQQTNLVSDLGTLGAQTVDPKLKNPWGIARGPSPNKSQTTFITVITNVMPAKEDFSRACNGDFLAVHDGFPAIAVRRLSFPL